MRVFMPLIASMAILSVNILRFHASFILILRMEIPLNPVVLKLELGATKP